MALRKHLSKPPIQEAILDVGFIGSHLDLDGLDSLATTFPEEKWKKKSITATTFEATIDGKIGAIQPTAVSAFEGYAMVEIVGHRIVQLREDRITCSHVNSYSDWETLESDLASVFLGFVEVGKPARISRIAARFVNRISMHGSFDQLLTFPPQVLPGLGDAKVTDFLRRQVVRGLANDFEATITIATVTPLPNESSNALLIDIDVYKQVDLPPRLDSFSTDLPTLRSIKNTLFFESVTDFALEPYT